MTLGRPQPRAWDERGVVEPYFQYAEAPRSSVSEIRSVLTDYVEKRGQPE